MLNNTSITCFSLFRNAQAARREYPLIRGLYKLEQVESELKSWLNTAWDIEFNGIPKAHCVNQDAWGWIQALPNHVVHTLGYDVVPAIEALAGDAISVAGVRRAYPTLSADCRLIVAEAERLRNVLRTDRANCSRFNNPLRDVQEILKDLLYVIERALRVERAKDAGTWTPW